MTTPDEDLHQRRFAGAVLAEQRRDLAAMDVEVHALERMDAAVGLGDVARGEHDPSRSSAAGGRRPSLIWTSTSTGVTSQFFGLTSVKAPTTEMVLPLSVGGVDAREHRLLHRVVDRRAGVLILDLVLELAELDLAGRVAQVGAVDRRAGLHPDADRVRHAWHRDVVDAGLAFADDAGELDREYRATAGRDAVLLGGGGLVGGNGIGEGLRVDGARLDARLDLRESRCAERLRREDAGFERPPPSRSRRPWCRARSPRSRPGRRRR